MAIRALHLAVEFPAFRSVCADMERYGTLAIRQTAMAGSTAQQSRSLPAQDVRHPPAGVGNNRVAPHQGNSAGHVECAGLSFPRGRRFDPASVSSARGRNAWLPSHGIDGTNPIGTLDLCHGWRWYRPLEGTGRG